jgi:hypothetical protein
MSSFDSLPVDSVPGVHCRGIILFGTAYEGEKKGTWVGRPFSEQHRQQ